MTNRGVLLGLWAAAVMSGCSTTSGLDERVATIVTDSASYAVHLEYGMYRAAISFVYMNGTRAAVSESYCQTPTPPALEKNVGGEWVVAYRPIYPECLSLAPFRVGAGETYRGALQLIVAPAGAAMAPALLEPPIAGTYRLHWALRAGDDPQDTNAPLVGAVSNSFELVER